MSEADENSGLRDEQAGVAPEPERLPETLGQRLPDVLSQRLPDEISQELPAPQYALLGKMQRLGDEEAK